jgi:hypothetical protein
MTGQKNLKAVIANNCNVLQRRLPLPPLLLSLSLACFSDKAFKPEGPSINAATDYPVSISSSDGHQATAAADVCPPTTVAGCVSVVN